MRDPSDPEAGKHPHFVCVDCGSVTCLGDMEFTAASRRRSTQIGRITEILIKGHCLYPGYAPTYYAAVTDAYIIYPWELDRGPEMLGVWN